MSSDVVCCTCASLLNAKPPGYTRDPSRPRSINEKAATDEKTTASSQSQHPIPYKASDVSRRVPCCGRVICTSCVARNPRFETYCPFCQISNTPSSLPQGLRDPPAYDPQATPPKRRSSEPHVSPDEEPPAYSSLANSRHQPQQQEQQEDTMHHLRPTDTMQSVSLAYGVSAQVLRSHNSLYSDHLISARRTLDIPASHYTGPSLSPDPVDDEEETERKSSIRRFMVGAKCADYEVAELYLGQADGNVDKALEAWREDERWERENPFDKGKLGRRRNDEAARKKTKKGSGGGLTGQLR